MIIPLRCSNKKILITLVQELNNYLDRRYIGELFLNKDGYYIKIFKI